MGVFVVLLLRAIAESDFDLASAFFFATSSSGGLLTAELEALLARESNNCGLTLAMLHPEPIFNPSPMAACG